MLSSAITSPSRAPAPGSPPTPRRGSPRSLERLASARREVRAERARRRERPSRWCSRPRRISTACRNRSSPRRRATAAERGHPGKHARSRCRARASSRSCNSRRGAICARRLSRAWAARGENGGARDNRAIVAETVRAARRARAAARLRDLRRLQARRHDGEDAARRARPARIRSGRRRARTRSREAEALQAMIAEEGGNFELAPWDWRYYAEKRRKALFDFDEGAIKPYLPLDSMIDAAFDVAGRLFGLSFAERFDVDSTIPTRAPGGERTRAAADRAVHRRLFRATREAQRRLDVRLPRPAAARRRRPADRRQRAELRQGGDGRAERCSASTRRARCSTNSATRCTACCPT